MICPNCGAEVNGSVNFCENCGSPISGEPSTQTQAASTTPQPPTEQTQAMPPASSAPYAQQQQPSQQPGAYDTPVAPGTSGPQPSIAPFVLAIIALATAILGLFPVSIILAIIALAMNSGQRKRGESSTKQTPTTVMSVISLVLSVIMFVVTIIIGGLFWTFVATSDFVDLDDLDDTPRGAVSSSSASSSGTPDAGASSSSATSSSAAADASSGASSAEADSSSAAASSDESSPEADSSAAAGSSSSSASEAKPNAIATVGDLVGSWKLTELVDDGVEMSSENIELMQSKGLEVSLSINEDGSCGLILFGVEMKGTWEASSPSSITLMLDGETIVCPVDVDTAKLYMEDDEDQLTFTKQ